MYDRSRMHRSKNNHPDLGSMSWPTDNTPREAEAFHTPTANRQPLPPDTGRVGTASRHSCLSVLPTTNRLPLTARGIAAVGRDDRPGHPWSRHRRAPTQ